MPSLFPLSPALPLTKGHFPSLTYTLPPSIQTNSMKQYLFVSENSIQAIFVNKLSFISWRNGLLPPLFLSFFAPTTSYWPFSRLSRVTWPRRRARETSWRQLWVIWHLLARFLFAFRAKSGFCARNGVFIINVIWFFFLFLLLFAVYFLSYRWEGQIFYLGLEIIYLF